MKRFARSPGVLESVDVETPLSSRNRRPKANKGKTICLSRTSHELRTPLTTIIDAAEILKKKALNMDQRQMLKLIEQGPLGLNA